MSNLGTPAHPEQLGEIVFLCATAEKGQFNNSMHRVLQKISHPDPENEYCNNYGLWILDPNHISTLVEGFRWVLDTARPRIGVSPPDEPPRITVSFPEFQNLVPQKSNISRDEAVAFFKKFWVVELRLTHDAKLSDKISLSRIAGQTHAQKWAISGGLTDPEALIEPDHAQEMNEAIREGLAKGPDFARADYIVGFRSEADILAKLLHSRIKARLAQLAGSIDEATITMWRKCSEGLETFTGDLTRALEH